MKSILILSFLGGLLLTNWAEAQIQSQSLCDSIKDNYKKNGIDVQSNKASDTPKNLYSTGIFQFSGPGILSGKNINLVCASKEKNYNDSITLFGMGIVVDKNKVDMATKTILEKYLFLNVIESPHKEKLKDWFVSKMKNLRPNSYENGTESKSGMYYLKLTTTQADKKGNISMLIHMQIDY